MGWIVVIFVAIIIFAFITSHIDSANREKRTGLLDEYTEEFEATRVETCDQKISFVAYNNKTSKIAIGRVSEMEIVREKIVDNFDISTSFNSLIAVGYIWSYIAFDNIHNKLLVTILDDNNIKISVIDYDNIIGVELMQDGVAIASKSTGRTVGGALLGGVIAGGAGAIVGGLSGDSTTSNNITSLTIKIRIKDVYNPSVIIDWWKTTIKKGMSKKEILKQYNDFVAIADTISVIIDKTGSKHKEKTNKNVKTTTSSSIADEIMKLAKLKEMGAITEAEFEQQKKVLLS